MRIEYRIPRRQKSSPTTFKLEPASEPPGRAPRLARLVALAHKLEGLVRCGKVADYGQLAGLGHISPGRLSQILILAQLAPAIQERILFQAPWEDGTISERDLREIAREVLWQRQLALFQELQSRVPGRPS